MLSYSWLTWSLSTLSEIYLKYLQHISLHSYLYLKISLPTGQSYGRVVGSSQYRRKAKACRQETDIVIHTTTTTITSYLNALQLNQPKQQLIVKWIKFCTKEKSIFSSFSPLSNFINKIDTLLMSLHLLYSDTP